ncbi:MAG: AbrB/MazE/SpoVT family DNA-binding domain-containing protein [Chloroflexi bacterium]|nr:AbrB/MazE/SpoVT family DNA-binding domain-containing protein [Chloroflexota bacterium]
MRASIVRIGNSRGLRIPRTLLEECGIRDTVELSVENGRLIVQPVRSVREGWAQAAHAMAERGEDRLLDPETPTDFDETEWEW